MYLIEARRAVLLPTRGCGLKCQIDDVKGRVDSVAPHTGMWIEITIRTYELGNANPVAPHTGMWIEIL